MWAVQDETLQLLVIRVLVQLSHMLYDLTKYRGCAFYVDQLKVDNKRCHKEILEFLTELILFHDFDLLIL